MRAATVSVGLVSPRSTCESIGALTPLRTARSRSDSPEASRSAFTRAPIDRDGVRCVVGRCRVAASRHTTVRYHRRHRRPVACPHGAASCGALKPTRSLPTQPRVWAYCDHVELVDSAEVRLDCTCTTGRSFATAVAAIIASYVRAVALRPARRSDAATRPNARAASASNASGAKSASACWRWAWRASTLSWSARDERADRRLRERDRGDEWFVRGAPRRREVLKHDERRGVEDASRWRCRRTRGGGVPLTGSHPVSGRCPPAGPAASTAGSSRLRAKQPSCRHGG